MTPGSSTSRRATHRRSTLAIFAWPMALGVATLAGLILGLTGDGARDAAAWLFVGLAPLVIFAALLRRDRLPHSSKANP